MKSYTSRDVASLLGLPIRQVRAFARSGFLTPGRGPRGEYRFSFQDLVLLRTAKGLAAARVPARRIRRALSRLQQQLPRGRSLSEVRIAAQGDRVLVSDGRTTWNPESGQFLFDFAVSELATQVEPLARRAVQAAQEAGGEMDADDWYALALDLEACARAEARRAYVRALEQDPTHADALVNLGRLLHEDGRVSDAERHYRGALAANPRHATAAFNLGIALEDLRRPAEAEQAYHQALEAQPDFADAHFNLSRLYERQGDRVAALRHLKSYKGLVEHRSRPHLLGPARNQ